MERDRKRPDHWERNSDLLLGMTVFGIFFTPVLYSVIRWLTARRKPTAGLDVKGIRTAKVPELAAVGGNDLH